MTAAEHLAAARALQVQETAAIYAGDQLLVRRLRASAAMHLAEYRHLIALAEFTATHPDLVAARARRVEHDHGMAQLS